ncbi:MAG: nitrogen regulation protein NR(II) [Steroidobacteraceae bacterium]
MRLSAATHAPRVVPRLEPSDLLDALATGVLLLDSALCPIYANFAAQDLLDFSLQHTRGRPLAELCGSSRLGPLLERALETGAGFAVHELAVSPKAAPPRVLDVTVSPIGGGTAGVCLLLELADATQRQRISRESELLNRFDGSRAMLRQLTHEIRNPLGGLRGAAQLLDKELAAAPGKALAAQAGEGRAVREALAGLREYTDVIISEADRLATLVDSMNGPRQPQRRSLTNVHELCERVRHLLAAEASEGVAIARDYDPSLPSAMLDRDQLIQALLNVARNALQAIGERGRITLRTRALSNVTLAGRKHRLAASVQVEDDGPGVPQELRASLFYPLVTGRASGSGLGLAVAQDIVVRHGGLIEFDSEPGCTRFTLQLPLESPQ